MGKFNLNKLVYSNGEEKIKIVHWGFEYEGEIKPKTDWKKRALNLLWPFAKAYLGIGQ